MWCLKNTHTHTLSCWHGTALYNILSTLCWLLTFSSILFPFLRWDIILVKKRDYSFLLLLICQYCANNFPANKEIITIKTNPRRCKPLTSANERSQNSRWLCKRWLRVTMLRAELCCLSMNTENFLKVCLLILHYFIQCKLFVGIFPNIHLVGLRIS